MNEAYRVVRQFESAVCEYTGSPFAVAVDSCTSALFLCCKYLKVEEVRIPSRTYCSVPCAIIHAGGRVCFRDIPWKGAYRLGPYPIIDSAQRFRRSMYVSGQYHCLSFYHDKHIAIGRGGMILCDDLDAVDWFRLARFNGRHEIDHSDDTPAMVGWNMTLEPEKAARGLVLLSKLGNDPPDFAPVYPDLSKNPIYQTGGGQ